MGLTSSTPSMETDRLQANSFYPVHDRLLYKEHRENWGAWSYCLPDRKLSRLHDTSLRETEPAWSPDGSTLALVAHYGDEDELWLVTLVPSPTATCAYTRMAKTHP